MVTGLPFGHNASEKDNYCDSNELPCQFLSPVAQQPLEGQGPLIIEASRSHSDTPHSVGILWTSDRLDAETCT